MSTHNIGFRLAEALLMNTHNIGLYEEAILMSTHNIGFRLAEALLMSTHNIGFYEDLTKIIFELASNIIKYAPYFCCCCCLSNIRLQM